MTLYATSPGSITGQVSFLIEGFPLSVRQMSGNLGHFISGYHLAIDHLNHPNPSTDGDDLSIDVVYGRH